MITTNLENTSGSLSREKTFEKNILLFGSTGLTGSLVFEYLLDPCFYLNSAVELRELLLEAIEEGLENVTIKTCLYCFNRKIGEPLDKYLKSPSANSFGPFCFNGSQYHYNKGTCVPLDIDQDIETSNDATFDGFLYYKDKGKNVTGKNPISGEYYGKEYMYYLEYMSAEGNLLKLNFIFNHIQLIIKNSFSWPSVIPIIFSDEVEAISFREKMPLKRYFPLLSDIKTMISTIGTTTNRNKISNTTYNDIDYHLNVDLVKAFSNTDDKSVIIVTSFNNTIISTVSPYFKIKMKLESTLANAITPPLKTLTILRPGPLVGRHSDIYPTHDSILKNSSLFERALLHKRAFLQNMECFVDDIRTGGMSIKASEIVARTFYRIPGSKLLGYCIPAQKVAYAISIAAVDKYLHEEPLTRVVTSEEMDNMK